MSTKGNIKSLSIAIGNILARTFCVNIFCTVEKKINLFRSLQNNFKILNIVNMTDQVIFFSAVELHEKIDNIIKHFKKQRAKNLLSTRFEKSKWHSVQLKPQFNTYLSSIFHEHRV